MPRSHVILDFATDPQQWPPLGWTKVYQFEGWLEIGLEEPYTTDASTQPIPYLMKYRADHFTDINMWISISKQVCNSKHSSPESIPYSMWTNAMRNLSYDRVKTDAKCTKTTALKCFIVQFVKRNQASSKRIIELHKLVSLKLNTANKHGKTHNYNEWENVWINY